MILAVLFIKRLRIPVIPKAPPPPPPPLPPYAAHQPRSAVAGHGPRSPRVSAHSPPRGRPPHPTRVARGGSRPQIEHVSHHCSPRALPPHRPVPGAPAAAARGTSPVPIPVAAGPDLRVGATTTASAAVATGSDMTGSTSTRRVKFASPLCYRPVRRYYSATTTPTKSCLRSATERHNAQPAGHSSPPLQSASPGYEGDFPSRGGRLRAVTGAWQKAGEAHSCEDEDGWSMVRPRRWWRLPEFKTTAHSTPSTTQVKSARHHLSEELQQRLRGKCFRCLSPGHAAANCRDPVRCFSCGRWGHKSNVCFGSSSSARQQPPPPRKTAPPPLDDTNFPPLRASGMARPGDPSVRPLDTCAVAFSVDNMDHELDRLSMHGMVAWLGGNRPVVEPEVIKRAICHYTAKRAVARACDLDYVEKSSLDRADTRALCVWAWTHNPSDIPKVTWLTLSCRKAEAHNSLAARGRRGLTFRVLVHLDLVEDPPDRDGRAAAPRVYTWDYGVVDGERTPCDRHDPPPADIHGSHRDDDNDHRGCRERQGDNWYSRLTRSLSRAPKDRERERSLFRHGGRRHQSPECGGRRRPLHDVAAGHGARQSTLGDAAGASTGARQQLAMPADPGRPVDVHRRTRGRSRERTPHQRPHRHARSEPRTTTPRSKSPSPRLRYKSPDFNGGNGNNHHLSPSPPKVRANHSQCNDLPLIPSVSAPPTCEPDVPPVAAALSMAAPPSNSYPVQLTGNASPSCLNEPQVPPVGDHDIATQQRSCLTADRHFRTGQVYARRPCAPRTHRTHAQPTENGQVVRFRPGIVYSRPCVRGMANSYSSRSCMANGLQHQLPEQTTTALEVPVRQHSPPQRRKRPLIPARRSVRIAAMNWPRGDTQAKARQVLMKRLGILDMEGLSHDDALLRYFSLFKGPLTDDTVKVLTALCGLHAAAALPTTHA
ncbi:uncharacterized protein [Miscanthus floridulus]|uniref:uncharacterized protein n=1 Tax=Miscanthus floridulus TaxID=154761 RepID=UPI0034593029